MSARASKRAQVETIHHMFKENKDIYGARRIQKHLEVSGTYMSEWKVRRIRRENEMYYPAAVIELYNREIIGYSTGKNMDTELVKQVITKAIARYHLSQGTIFIVIKRVNTLALASKQSRRLWDGSKHEQRGMSL